MTSRTVYALDELAGNWERTQPTPVDGTSYTEPGVTTGDVYAYTAEDDAAAALQEDILTLPTGIDGRHAIVWAAMSDETDTAAVGTAPTIAGVNEVQDLDSTATGGTFTLTHSGNTTAALNSATATAGQVQTELEGLASISPGDVTVTGGPFVSGGAGSTISIEFTGALAESNEALTVNDSSTGGTVVATEATAGEAPTSMTLYSALNVPQAGDNFQPQLHVWTAPLTTALEGRTIDVTHADHDTLRTIASGLLIAENLDATTQIEGDAETAGNAANFADLGTITPSTEGAKVLALLAKAKAGGAGVYYTTTDSPSAPQGLTVVHEAQADAMTVTAYLSGVLDADVFDAGDPTWGQSALWAGVLLSLKPATAATTGGTLEAAVNEESTSTWIDMSDAAGNMYEVLELDLSAVPAGAVVTSANVEIGHSCSVRNALRTVLVGINADDTINPCVEQQPTGYVPLPVGQVSDIVTADWQNTADGTPLSDFTRFGVALISSTRHPLVADHRIYWVRSSIKFDEGGPVVSSVVGPATAGDPITWVYSSDAGLSQTHYQVMLIAGASQDPTTAAEAANPLDAATGEIIHDTGQVPGILTRSVELDAPLARGSTTVAVRAWATTTSGQSVASAWATANFDVTGTPTAPGTQSTEPVFNATTGGVDVEVTVPSGVTRAWLLRSEDSGATYEVTAGSPFTVTPLSTETITDYYAPTLVDTIRYKVTFDAGAMTETDVPVQAGSGSDISTPAAAWYFRVDDDSSLNTSVFVRDFSTGEGLRALVAEQGATTEAASRALVATSKTLAVTLRLSIWVLSGAERLAVANVIRSGYPIRVSDIWGREYLVRPVEGQRLTPRKAKGNLATSRPLRDAHVVDVTLVGSILAE